MDASSALGALRIVAASGSLCTLLGDVEPRVRAEAARALGALRTPEAVDALASVADDPAPEVRRACIGALGELGEGRCLAVLASRLADSQPEVRLDAALALGAVGTPAIPYFLATLRSGTRNARIAALNGLEQVQVESNNVGALSDVAAAYASDDWEIRRAAGAVLRAWNEGSG